MFIEYKMFGKLKQITKYSQCIYLLNQNSYQQNPKDFLKNFKNIKNIENFYINLEKNLKYFLKSLDLNEKK